MVPRALDARKMRRHSRAEKWRFFKNDPGVARQRTVRTITRTTTWTADTGQRAGGESLKASVRYQTEHVVKVSSLYGLICLKTSDQASQVPIRRSRMVLRRFDFVTLQRPQIAAPASDGAGHRR